MNFSKSLGSFEEIVLLAIVGLTTTNSAYGTSIRKRVSEATQREIAVGALYSTLERLEAKKLVSSWRGEATPERGGRPKRFFRIEGAGKEALEAMDATRKKLKIISRGSFGLV